MSSNKTTILLSLAALIALSGVNAQVATGGSYNWRDSSLIPAKRAAQQKEFLNNQYNYPAKPRSQWELGLKVGNFNVNGDVASLYPNLGFGAHLRKSLGYAVSMRFEYNRGVARGLNWSYSENYHRNTAWTSTGYVPNRVDQFGNRTTARDRVFYNYKATVNDFSVQTVLSLNNILFHKSQSKFGSYLLGGVGIMWYETFVNALNGTTRYNFSGVTSSPNYPDRRDIQKALKNLLDDSYETPAEAHGNKKSALFNGTSRASATLGAGIAFKLSKKVNLAIEDRLSFVSDDLLDGQRWQEYAFADAVMSRNFDTYNFLSAGLNFNLGSPSKRSEPLYWMNPLDFAYSELNAPKRMKLPKPVLDDADGDGVTDQFDNEPNTPSGCPVDNHGVSRDTDGDGVADCKDKQLITPSECQPVDADGVGKCPEPACCKNIVKDPGCGNMVMPSVSFKGNSVKLSPEAEAALSTLAGAVRNSPSCKLVVTGYGEPTKSGQQMSWDRVNAVINYMVDKQGISADRFIFRHGQPGGDPNTVDIRGANDGEQGPNAVPAPHPNLSRKN